MIAAIEKVIRKEFAAEAGTKPLAFIKYSTPGSGKGLADKVLFFIFCGDESEPRWCVKTVRSLAAGESVVRSFNNLKRFNTLAQGSSSEGLFAQALYVRNDEDGVFSIETVCKGTRRPLSAPELTDFLRAYTAFQAHAAKKQEGTIGDLRAYAATVLAPVAGSDALLRYIDTLPPLAGEMPRLLQHGDLTEDNILVSAQGFAILDCEYAGMVDIPGFDVFALLMRRGAESGLLQASLDEHFAALGIKLEGSYKRLCFLYYALERMLRKGYTMPAAELIAGFERDCAMV